MRSDLQASGLTPPCAPSAPPTHVTAPLPRRYISPSRHPRPVVHARAAETETERKIAELIGKGLQCERIEVRDTSGGCGSMYDIKVVAEAFR